jgi:hypothetical protein
MMIVVRMTVITCKKPFDAKINLEFLGNDNGKKRVNKEILIFFLSLV